MLVFVEFKQISGNECLLVINLILEYSTNTHCYWWQLVVHWNSSGRTSLQYRSLLSGCSWKTVGNLLYISYGRCSAITADCQTLIGFWAWSHQSTFLYFIDYIFYLNNVSCFVNFRRRFHNCPTIMLMYRKLTVLKY